MHDMNEIIGSHDFLFVVLDTLRYDVASSLCAAGRTPTLQRHLPDHATDHGQEAAWLRDQDGRLIRLEPLAAPRVWWLLGRWWLLGVVAGAAIARASSSSDDEKGPRRAEAP